MDIELKAGRELDALVAEKVIGLTALELRDPEVAGYAFPEEVWAHIPEYSTDIADAWLVVEKVKDLKPDPHSFGLQQDHHQLFRVDWDGRAWQVGWAPINLDGVTTVDAESESLPLAICLAALRAVGALK